MAAVAPTGTQAPGVTAAGRAAAAAGAAAAAAVPGGGAAEAAGGGGAGSVVGDGVFAGTGERSEIGSVRFNEAQGAPVLFQGKQYPSIPQSLSEKKQTRKTPTKQTKAITPPL